MSIQLIKSRKDVSQSDTWKLEDLFESDLHVNNAFKESEKFIGTFKKYKNEVLSTSVELLELLKLNDLTRELVYKIYLYCNARLHQDTSNPVYQDLSSRSSSLLIKFNTETSFISTELSQLSVSQLDTFIAATPELTLYKRYINEILRAKPHILDSATEQLLSQFGEIAEASSRIFSMFNNADIKFPSIESPDGTPIQISHGNYTKLLAYSNQTFRKNVFDKFYGCYLQFQNTLAQAFSSNVAQLSLFSKLRHYDSPLSAKLSTHNIPTTVYTNLIETINIHLPILHDYMALRKNTLALEELHLYDLFTPLVKDIHQTISFDEACEIVLKSVEPLGEEYVTILKTAFNSRWIDKYENVGKRSGAYSWGTYGAPHPYILMNYNDTLDNLFTLAHEMGHALHSYLSNETQPGIYAGYSIFVAEVASTVNESLLMQYLLKITVDVEQRKYLLNHFMEQFRNTVYRQTMFAEFEKTVYDLYQDKQILTATVLSDIYYRLVKKYHGENIVIDDAIRIEWARIPHFYTPFYVYQYATGFSAAIALSQQILEDGQPAVERYLNFLSSGSSKDPIDLLKDAGVDMTSSKPIAAALSVFKGLIDTFRTL